MLQTLSDLVTRHASIEALAAFYEKAPRSGVRWLAEDQFRQVVRYAGRHSPFYRRAFAKRGIDPAKIRRPADLGDFYTTPEDLAERAEEFLCRPPSIVFESSGTSGRNKLVYYGRDELEAMGRMMASGLRMMGLTREDRVANAFDFSIWIPGLLAHYGLMAAGNFCLAFGKVDPLEVYRRLAQHRFSVVMGEPTWLIRLTELAEREGAPPLRLLIGAAEEMPAAAIPWMRRVWGGARIKMCYGSVEQGSALGFQPCDQAESYHLDDIDFLSEILDPDAEGWGELVFTTLRRRVMPLIRYRTRDVTRLLSAPCPCGRRAPRISRLRGRSDELVVASGGNLYPKLFEDILDGVPGLGLDWQVVFRLEGVHEVMEIHVEPSTERGRPDTERLRQQIVEQAAHKYPDLVKNLALGIFELRVQVHPPGTMRVQRKLKRMIDLRHGEPLGDGAPPRPVETAGNGRAAHHE